MNHSRAAVIAAAISAGAAVAATAAMVASAQAAAPPLVYICQAQPCRNAQELEVSDASGAPIFSVAEYGGASAFGDNISVYAPGSVYHPAVTVSYQSPGAYDKAHGLAARCTAPATWYEPHGIWACTASGTWTRKVSF